MRKYIVFILMVLVLTGCGNKTLKCELTIDGAKIEQVTNYSNNKMKKASIKYTYDLTLLTNSQQEILKEMSFCDDSKSILGYSLENCTQKSTDTNIIVEGNVILDTYSLSSKTYDEMKKYNEQSGYSCK